MIAFACGSCGSTRFLVATTAGATVTCSVCGYSSGPVRTLRDAWRMVGIKPSLANEPGFMKQLKREEGLE